MKEAGCQSRRNEIPETKSKTALSKSFRPIRFQFWAPSRLMPMQPGTQLLHSGQNMNRKARMDMSDGTSAAEVISTESKGVLNHSSRNLARGVWELARLHTREAWLCWYPAGVYDHFHSEICYSVMQSAFYLFIQSGGLVCQQEQGT